MTRFGRCYGRMLLFGVLLCGSAGLAVAQQPSQAQSNAIKQSCRSDYQSYCSSVPAGGKASLQCLQDHLTSLSPNCQGAVNAVAGGGTSSPPASASQAAPPAGARPPMSPRQEAAMMRQSCGGDFRAYCQGVQPGGGRALACLSQNEARLSSPCKGALAEARASH